MSGQVDIGWAAPPFGLKEIEEGKIRIVGRGSEVPSLRGQTVRVLIVNADALKNQEGRDCAFRRGLSGRGRLDVFRPEGDHDVRQEDQERAEELIKKSIAAIPARAARCRPKR